MVAGLYPVKRWDVLDRDKEADVRGWTEKAKSMFDQLIRKAAQQWLLMAGELFTLRGTFGF